MIENDRLPSRVVSSWFRSCLYETELPGKHEAYVLKWATSTRQITKFVARITSP